jgi:mono/diheme cytochrome c family protein
MKSKLVRVLVFAAMVMGINGAAVAAGKEKAKVDLGKQEYLNSCAVCHGADGKAQTQVMDILKVAPPDLRQLSKKNGGVFPMARVYETIDGRLAVKSHGTRDMPMWGQRYSVEAAPIHDDYPYNAEVSARARILGLIDYLYRLQEK